MFSDLGIRVGHWTDSTARTGCTVVLFDDTATASGEVRGGAPASRELEVLSPQRTVTRIDAALLTGGSAFGLAAADGVMRHCEERSRGVPTPAGRVPIVPALALYDLAAGDATVRPGPAQGYAACEAAVADPVTGQVGAGCGATIGHVTGRARPGGIAIARLDRDGLSVAAIVAVNAFGDIDDGDTAVRLADTATPQGLGAALLSHTVIGVVVTNAELDKLGCLRAAQGAHDGLSRAIVPPHSRVDGDAFIAASTGSFAADVDVVRLLSLAAVERAIRSLA